jgi:hypothetical protein
MIGRSYVSSMNTYKEPFIAPDSRIHANYRQVGARTGRMSCSDPNMQNQPRDDLRLRYNIVADPGYVKLVTCDLSNIEMVLFAAYCGEGRLLNAVERRRPARPDREDAGPARPQASGRRRRDGPPVGQDVQLLAHLRRRPAHHQALSSAARWTRLACSRSASMTPTRRSGALQNRIEYRSRTTATSRTS